MKDRTLTAYHEAGHALAALELGLGLDEVSIRPGRGHPGGYCVQALELSAITPAVLLVYAAAGPLAESRIGGDAWRDLLQAIRGGGPIPADWTDARMIVQALGHYSTASRAAILRWAADDADGLLTRQWGAVKRLVGVLLLDECLSGDRATGILKGCVYA
jgi:hypothetical protein